MDADSGPPPMTINSEPVISDLIDLTIKTIDSKNFQFQVESDIQIKVFKEKIATEVGIEPESQRMIFCGRVLSDDKTLKDYNIDNGRTIHLVKKAAPPKPNNTNNTANQQNDQNPNRHRGFTSYSNEDGSSVFMGTISLDSTNGMINQMVRQLFTGHRSTGDGSSGATSAGQENSIRSRFNYIRRFIGYISTNFQILEHPDQLPSTANPAPEPTEPLVLASEYTALFNEALAVSDRIRPHLNSYFQSLSTQPSTSDARAVQSNHSILMRITHHLSHVMHLLSEFNVDLSSPNMPLTLNVLVPPVAPVPTTTSSSTESNSSSTTTSSTATSSIPNVSARIEISTPTVSSASMPRFSGTIPSGSALFAQSPIVLMEVDTTLNVPRNAFMQGLNLGNFSFPQNLASNSTSQQAAQNSASFSNATNTTTSTSTSTANTTSHPASNTSSTTSTNSPSGTAQSNPSPNIPSNSVNIDLSGGALAFTFDPFLNCNSAYTVPEVRSATNIGSLSDMNQIVNSLTEQLGQSTGAGGPMFSGLSSLFQSLENASSQSSDEFEFQDLMRFLISQFGLNHDNEHLHRSSQIGDFLRNMGLFSGNSENGSIMEELFSVLFQNLNFDDLLHIINSEFHDFNRFREPFQGFIRNALQCTEFTIENIRNNSALHRYITNNHNSFITIVANITPAQGVDTVQSFENFLRETMSTFFHRVMSSNSDESFERDILDALKYLVSSYIQFCRVCFADQDRAISQLITNYFEQYANYLNPRIRSFMTNMIVERINAYSGNLEIDPSVTSEIQQHIVRTSAPAATNLDSSTAMQVETTTEAEPEAESEPDRHSISNDSEVEFSDCISDFPSTSSTQRVLVTEGGEEPGWQSVVPADWVPIINEDIQKQKNIDSAHQPPFSDAYLNGMPKKRRLEYKPDEDEPTTDPKFRPKSQ